MADVAQWYHAANDWLAAYDRLRAQGSMAQPESTQLWASQHPGWWWGTTPEERASGQAQAIPLGDLGDPISQLAGLASPFLRAAMQAAAAQPAVPLLRGVGNPYGRASFLRNQRGNLGPPPMNARGEPLPESVTRDPQAGLQRLYHGTPVTYDDFLADKVASPNNVYGPGIYMTTDPGIAEGYAVQTWTPESRRTIQQIQTLQAQQALARARARQAATPRDAQPHLRAAEDAARQEATLRAQIGGMMDNSPDAFAGNAQIRPVYADIRRPFDLTAPLTTESKDTIEQALRAYYHQQGQAVQPWELSDVRSARTPQHLYEALEMLLPSRTEVNQVLQRAGYDGLTHFSGGDATVRHRVWIAFSPDQVYPSFNVPIKTIKR